MRSLARRVQLLDAEIDEHDRALKQLLDQAAPQLVAERGIGYVTAAQFYIAWSHPGRCHSEAAFARLGGTSPVPATSGQNQTRHRLNRGGDRQLNRALYLVAITKQRCDPTTKAYIARRVAEGKTEREAIRCIKRFLARRVWRLLEHPPNHHLTDIEASVRWVRDRRRWGLAVAPPDTDRRRPRLRPLRSRYLCAPLSAACTLGVSATDRRLQAPSHTDAGQSLCAAE